MLLCHRYFWCSLEKTRHELLKCAWNRSCWLHSSRCTVFSNLWQVVDCRGAHEDAGQTWGPRHQMHDEAAELLHAALCVFSAGHLGQQLLAEKKQRLKCVRGLHSDLIQIWSSQFVETAIDYISNRYFQNPSFIRKRKSLASVCMLRSMPEPYQVIQPIRKFSF